MAERSPAGDIAPSGDGAGSGYGVIGVWRGAERVDAVDASDRGLAYGDGLFETMRASGGRLPWWSRHFARLARGAQRLGIDMPREGVLDAALSEALVCQPSGVIKLVVTRGAGARGYWPAAPTPTTLVVSAMPPPAAWGRALKVDLLDVTLGSQPMLAGIKHLNRLEQVLGAREAAVRGLDEGLMQDASGHVTCGTRCNVFLRLGGRWVTPAVEQSGVAGIAREVLLEAWTPPGGLSIASVSHADLSRAEALLCVNAVRGILLAGQLGERTLDPRPNGLSEARAALAASHPAFRES